MTNHSTVSDNLKKYIVTILTGLLILFAAGYGYFLQQTVDTVVTRSEVSKQITQLRSEIGDAQERYGTEIGAATMEKARDLGFKSVESSRYVARYTNEGTLVLRDVTSKQ